MLIKRIADDKYLCHVPDRFSIVENTRETVYFFYTINAICSKMKVGTIYYNMEQLEFLSIDAVMYIIALAYRVWGINSNIRFALNRPKKRRLRTFINQCGLNEFLKESECEDCDDEYYVIKLGSQTDTNVAEEISIFAKKKSNRLEQKHISMLYKMLIEMMNNSMEHAYTDIELQNIKRNSRDIWFVFIENSTNKLKFTFLDTGIGIPNSIFKKNKGSENEIEIMFGEKKNSKKTEDSYIFRAMTGKIERANKANSNRGRGLPEIYGYYKSEDIFSNLCIISGNEKCKFFDSNRSEVKFDHLDSELQGTLYYWEVKKGG